MKITTTVTANRTKTDTATVELSVRQRQVRDHLAATLPKPDSSLYRLDQDASQPETVPALGAVFCHWGHSERQLAATRKGLEAFRSMRPRPARTILVEAQFDGIPDLYDFGDRLDYFALTLPDSSEGLFLKESLWNFGAAKLLADQDITKLLFLDADVVFCDPSALASLSATLDACDLAQPFSWAYYADQGDGWEAHRLNPSTCRAWLDTGKAEGHCGFGVAMTREFWGRLGGGFEPVSSVGGDTWFWQRVFGGRRRPFLKRHACYNYGNIRGMGMFPFPRIGCPGETVAHLYHGRLRARLYGGQRVISRACTSSPGEDLDSGANGIPTWADTPGGRLGQKCQLELAAIKEERETPAEYTDENVAARAVYDKFAMEEYGNIDADHPLVVACCYRAGGPYTPAHVRLVRDLWAKYCQTKHTFICLSDTPIDGVATIPLKSTAAQTPYYYSQIELYRSDLYPKGASVLLTDLDAFPIREFSMHRCPLGHIYMGMELHNWYLSNRVVWNGGVVYFRGDFGFIINQFLLEQLRCDAGQPWFTFISSQEWVAGCLYRAGIVIEDILAHLQLEFYDNNGICEPHTTLMHFLYKPKPWELKTCPDWLPEIVWKAGGATAYSTANQ